MSQPNGQPEIDVLLYEENRRKIPWEALEPYAGMWVAFSADGTRILAGDPDIAVASAKVDALGIPRGQVGWARIPGMDEDCWV